MSKITLKMGVVARPIMAMVVVSAASIGFSGQAQAHATLEVKEAAAGSRYKAVMRVPHGCDGQATHTVSIKLPEGFVKAKPMPKAGWKLEVKEGPYEKSYQYYGKTLTKGPRELVWSGGNLPDNFYDEFVFRGKLMDVKSGETLFFPVTQICADGSVEWKELPVEGSKEKLKRPAPKLKITAPEHHAH